MLKAEEIKINLPFGGFIAGKFWGNSTTRPIVCLHGWLDNAGSFDRLIPLLPTEHSYLAIDFQGHGRSSWLPNGVHYGKYSNLVILTCLMNTFKWNKISIIGHSMGSSIGFMFAALYPEKVDFFVSIDLIKPPTRGYRWITHILKSTTDQFLITDQRHRDAIEPPAYTNDEIIDKIVSGTDGSVTKETAQFLLERNIEPSKKFPGKFYFSRDSRLKFFMDLGLPHDIHIQLIKNFKVPCLALKSSRGPYYEKKSYVEDALEHFKHHKLFEYHLIDTSSHHFHLTEPEKIAGIISKFIRKHRPATSHL